jgi:hypothetical protein
VLSVSGCVSSLERAVESSDYEAVREEIARGGNVEGNFWSSIKMPIARAVENNDLEMVKLLHENGVAIHPAMVSAAAQAGAVDTYKYLTENGGDLTACWLDQGYPGWSGKADVGSMLSPLGSSIMRRDLPSVEVLLGLGAPLESNCEVPTGLGKDHRFSAVLVAAIAGNAQVTEVLLGAGAEPNRLSVEGRTPLSLAAERGHYDVARALLAHGAFHTYTNEIKQPIEYAIDAGNHDVVNLLEYAGATRPVRRNQSSVWANVGKGALDGVKYVAAIYVVYLGARYSGYNSNYAPSGTSINSDALVRGTQSVYADYGSDSDDNGECQSDLDCSALEVCVKQPLHAQGICVNDGGQTRLDPGHNTTESAFPRTDNKRRQDDCPLGTRWDLIYQACIN